MSVAALSASTGGPRLRADLAIVEQVFRGETSFVVKDPSSRKYFRFRPVEMGVMRQFDGTRSVDEIVAALADQGLKLTARAVEAFARKLGSIGLLERTLAERTTLELERIRADRRRRRRPAIFRGELLRMRWSFGDPDRLFDRTLPALRWMFTRAFALASVALFASYFLILGATWQAFSATVSGLYSLSTISFASIVVLWLTGLIVILIHELGHGYACKYLGGEVHEMGFMLIYFQPAFYCNVNDAWSFPALRARLWVTAAGGWIQLVLASVAAIVWYVARPGSLVSEIAVAAMIVGGATTLVTNANPLLPLDGYFALTDWLEIPNLRLRARAYFTWWIRRHVLRMDLPAPASNEREQRVFLIYGSLSFLYIAGLLSLIALWFAGKAHQAFGAIGLTLFVAGLFLLIRKPLLEWARTIMLAMRKLRASGAGSAWWRWPAGIALGMLIVLSVLPWTLTATGDFIVAPVQTLEVTAPDSGVLGAIFVREGMAVSTGAPLARLVDRALDRSLLAAAGQVDSLTVATARARAAHASDLAGQLDAERAEALARFAALKARGDAMTLRARSNGTVTTPHIQEREGQRVDAGATIMRVATLDTLEARVSLSGAGAATVAPGQVIHLVAFGDVANPIEGVVAAVSASGGGAMGAIEVRVPVRGWRAGSTGAASVELRRSTALAALWWAMRQRVRNDLML